MSGLSEATGAHTKTVQILLRDMIQDNLPPDLPTADEILSMRPRALRRALSAEGSQYRDLIERARYHHAAKLLKQEPEITLTELAFHLN